MAITVKHKFVSAIPDAGDTTIVQPSNWNDDHDLVGTIPVANGGTGASTLTGYVKGNGTSAMTAASTIPNTDITGLGTASTKDAGVALGVATLDAGGKVPVSELPAAVLGALSYQGTWNASTNTPTLTSSVGTKGYYYVVSVAGSTDLNGITDWQIGDWAVYNGTVWQKVDNTDAGGDVVGPASATDNAIARFDTTTGKLIQNSVTLIDDTGNASGILSQQFSNGSAVTLAAGKMWYDGSTGAWNAGMGNGNITQQIGEELFIYGKASAAITDSPLQIVYHTGTVGASGVITFAPTIAGITDENAIIGVATENLALNAFGRVTSFGVVRGITTNGSAFGETWADDDVIWYNPVTGNPTNVKPSAPNIKFQIGLVIKAGAGGSGSFQVALVQGTALGGTDSNVKLTSATNGNILTYDGGNGYWKNTDLTAGTGISVSKSVNGVLTVTNTSPSSGGTVTSVAATVPSFLSISGSPITTSGTLALTYSGTALPLANGGTGATSAPYAMANLMGFTSTATAAGTTTLTNTSSYYQLFTGTLAQTVVLPVTSTLQTGWTFHICNNSTAGNITIQSSGGNSVLVVVPGTTAMVTCIATGGTGVADWEAGFTDFSTLTGNGAVVLNNGPTFLGTAAFAAISASGSVNFNTTASTITLGSSSGTAAITIGNSTVSQTTNIQAGATASGSTKTMNIGTGGLTGSTTTMSIGSTFGTTVTCNGTWNHTGAITTTSTLTAGSGVTGGIAGGTF
jgi:hypothetical protein